MSFPRDFVKAYGAKHGWYCHWHGCGRYWKDGWLLELHHRLPTSAGGKDTEENAELLCIYHHWQRHLALRKAGIDHPNSANLVYARLVGTKGRWR